MSIMNLFGTRLLTGLGALAIVGSVAGGTAIAGNPTGADKAKHEGMGPEVSAIRSELEQRVEPEREAIADLRRQLADEYVQDRPDEAKLARLHDAIEAHRETIGDMRQAALLDMHDHLTAEQRAKVAARMAGERGHGTRGDKAEGKRAGKGEGKAKREGEAKREGKPKRDAG